MRAQDSVFVIVAVAVNPKGRDMAWQFFKENNQKLLEQYQVRQIMNTIFSLVDDNYLTKFSIYITKIFDF